MGTLSNKDFRNLVQSDSADNDSGELTFSKLSAKQKLNAMKNEIQKEENVKRSKKGNLKKKKQIREQQKQQKEQKQVEPKTKYRDRAKERREAQEELNMEEFILSQAQEGVSVFSNNTTADDTIHLLRKIEQSEFQIRKSDNITTEQAHTQKKENKNAGLGYRIVRTIRQQREVKVTPTSEAFLPGRSSYVFNVERILGNDVPVTLIRSKLECISESERTFSPSERVNNIVQNAMQSIRTAKERASQKPEITQQENFLEQMEDTDSDEDIFPDAGDYCPVGVPKEAPVSSISAPKNYFKATSKIDTSVKLSNELLSRKQQKILQKLSTVHHNDETDEDDLVDKKEDDYYQECFEKEGNSEGVYRKYAYQEDAAEEPVDSSDDMEDEMVAGKRLRSEDIGSPPGPKRPKID